MKNNILADLDTLVKRASAQKTQAIKEASTSAKLDSAEDGTSPATTGEMAADQVRAQKEQYAEPSADVGGEDNSAGESVEQSTDEATAVSTDGQEGTKGGDLAAPGISDADNGPEDTDSPDNNGFNSGAFKSAAAEARKHAKELRKAASALLSPLDHFLIKSARATNNEKLKKQAMEMDDAELADAASDTLAAQLETGEIGDEEAVAILEEALASGAITEEDIAMATEAMGVPAEDEMMEAKIAAADIDPDHPEYLRKLASLYPAEIQAGYAFAVKLAEELRDQYEEEEEAPEEAAIEGAVAPEAALPPEEAAPVVDDAVGGEISDEADVMGSLEEELATTNPDEEAAMGAVGDELGLDEAALAELMAAPLPEEAEAEVMKVAKAMKTAGVSPQSRYRTVLLQKVAALRK